MKKIYSFFLFTMCCFLIGILTSNRSQNNKFYYAFDEKIYLMPEENKMMVKYNDGFNRNCESLFLTNFSSDIGVKWRNNTMAEITAPSGRKKNELKTLLEARKEVAACQQFYTLENGMDICMFDEIIVQFLPGVSKGQQEDFNRKFRTEVVKTYEIFQILKVAKGDDVLEVANQYFESGLVKFSKPNFLSNFKPFQVFPNDTYFERQITLHNIGQVFTDGHSGTNDADIDAPEAWDITTGSNNIIIAVIDEGVTSNHPDLPNTRQLRLVGSDFVDGDADPSPTGNNNHGNACAGVIAATMNNNQGITGIAPNCRIMPIRISYESSTVADFALAIRFAANNGAHIISNSWGLRDTDPFSFPPYSPNLYPEVVTAIQHAVNAGCVVLFAAGNTANHAANNDGFVSFPANVTIPGVITVGASDRNDHQANYSPTSNPAHPYNQIIDIVAPAHRAYPNQITGETFEMWSIDIPDSAGYNVWHGPTTPPTLGEVLPSTGTNHLAYTARFGGTSHACPVVAGVAALVLSVNPNLTNMEVFDILMNTAEDVGGYTYTNGRCDEMGYGRVNAYCAVQNALAPLASVSGADVVCTSGGSFSVTCLPPGTTINWNSSGNIDRTSPQGSNPCNFAASGSGEGWIDASIITSCGNEAIVIRKSVWAGTPSPYELDITNSNTGEDNLFSGVNNVLYVTTTDPQMEEIMGIDDYDWYYGSGFEHFEIEEYDKVSIVYVPDCSGSELVYVKPHNTCGYYEYWHFEYFSCSPYYYLAFTPNPTTGGTTLTIETNSAEKTFDESAEWDLEVYSETQLLKTKQTGLRGQSAKIQTAGWKEGVYMVRVNYNGEILTGKLLVKR